MYGCIFWLLCADPFTRTAMLSMYGRHGCLDEAIVVFECMPEKNFVSWNCMISLFGQMGLVENCIFLLSELMGSELGVSEYSFVGILSYFDGENKLQLGEQIHGVVIKYGFECVASVSNSHTYSALVDFYAKCNEVEEVHLCFDEITEKTSVSWNYLMLGYSKRDFSVPVRLLKDMFYLVYQPNEFSFSIVIKSSLPLELFQLHELTVKLGYKENAYVLSSLISSYARNGFVSDALIFVASDIMPLSVVSSNVIAGIVASDIMPLSVVSSNVIAGIYNRTGQYEKTQELFAVMEEPDVVSWNILIAACSRNGDYKEVFELFDHMRRSPVCPDNYTYVSLFSVCTKLCNLALGSSLHGLIMKTDFKSCDTFVSNIMIDMYGKCGSPESSVKIFNEINIRNVISWTALISALGLHGHANEALDKFREMEAEGFWPDKVAFLAVLSSFRHVGDVEQGMELFRQMKSKYGFEPEMDHYLLVVDLLARYGHLKEAEQLILGMPFPPNALIWRSFLEGCKRQRTMEDLALAV